MLVLDSHNYVWLHILALCVSDYFGGYNVMLSPFASNSGNPIVRMEFEFWFPHLLDYNRPITEITRSTADIKAIMVMRYYVYGDYVLKHIDNV